MQLLSCFQHVDGISGLQGCGGRRRGGEIQIAVDELTGVLQVKARVGGAAAVGDERDGHAFGVCVELRRFGDLTEVPVDAKRGNQAGARIQLNALLDQGRQFRRRCAEARIERDDGVLRGGLGSWREGASLDAFQGRAGTTCTPLFPAMNRVFPSGVMAVFTSAP